MSQFKRISIDIAYTMLQERDVQLVDIRDEQSYRLDHIEGARHLDNTSLEDFMIEANPELPVIVYCYHGNSSQPAAAFLNEKGFDDVYSMDGGFELWRRRYQAATD